MDKLLEMKYFFIGYNQEQKDSMQNNTNTKTLS
jgi:hypothetical protein